MPVAPGGFITEGILSRCNSEEQKKAEEGQVWNTYSFLARRDKSVARIERTQSLDCVLFGGRPADNHECQHRRPT